MNPNQRQPKVPEGQFPISAEDKKVIVELGRKVHSLVLDFAKANNGTLHARHVVGACEYLVGLINQKRDLVGYNILLAQKNIEDQNYGNLINEPFNDPEPVPPTLEERKAYLEKELGQVNSEMEAAKKPAQPATPEAQAAEVAAASVTPKAEASVPQA